MDHPIFHTPNAVEPSLEDLPTPKEYVGKDASLGATMPMWRVQTEGYTEGTGQLVGVVSRDAGFFDSPDTEWISGGVNTKGPNAVAIGRHGNFFHWGFAASPTYMTDEAKLVLVNALHYIAGFDGQAPVARKRTGVMLRTEFERVLYDLTDEGYAKLEARYAGYAADDAARKVAVQARIDAGEEVSEWDRQSLGFPATQVPGRLDGAGRLLGPELLAEAGSDPEQVAAYIRARMPYFYPGEWYTVLLDEDLMARGVGNDDVAVLELAIAELAVGGDAALGRRLLERYTVESFGDHAAWTAWLEASRDKLFYCETAGYKWLVDDRAAPLQAEPAAGPRDLEPSGGNPLDLDVTAKAGLGGKVYVTARFEVLAGWHAYLRVPPSLPYQVLSLELELPEGCEVTRDWTRPVAHLDPTAPGVMMLEGSFEMQAEVTVAAGASLPAELGCAVRYQVCTPDMCMPPAAKDLVLAVTR